MCGYFIHYQHSVYKRYGRGYFDITVPYISGEVILSLKIAANIFQIDRTFNILIIIIYEQRHRGDNITSDNNVISGVSHNFSYRL